MFGRYIKSLNDNKMPDCDHTFQIMLNYQIIKTMSIFCSHNMLIPDHLACE